MDERRQHSETASELEHSLSLYQAALESTADGLLIVGADGRVAGFNSNFLRLWRIPPAMASAGHDDALLAFVRDQLVDPDGFMTRVREVYATPDAVSSDFLEFTDGRVFARYSRPQVVAGAVVGRVWSFRDITDQRRAETALRQSEARLRQVVDLVPLAIFAKDEAGRYVLVNRVAAEHYGTTPDDLLGKTDREFNANPDVVEQLRAEDQAVIESGQLVRVPERQWVDLAGRARWVETIKIPFTLWGTGTEGVLGVTNDVTERRRLEAELRQSQKMEAIGRLAGGVAHDFNNLLTAILGFGGSLLDDVPADDPRRQDLEDIVKAARRAAELTRQLLAFGRRQVLRPRVVDLNAIVANLHRLLDRVLGADIIVEMALAPDLSAVKADPGQIEQVLLNLAVNGRDAMPNGGRLKIETANVPADSSRTSGAAAPGRPAVLLRVSDTGIGIAPDAMRWIFEPFFTTKEQGTGLGLAMVYGIIQQSGGSIEARSTPGQGTTFDCFLPATPSAVDPDEPARSIPPGRGSATILVAEDEDAVRRLAARLLEAEGFHVLAAATGAEALRLAESSGRTVDLLLTDLSMPRMSGPELAVAMQERRPGVRVAYMSGYPKDSLARQGLPEGGLPLLQKPFDRVALVSFVREALRSPAP